MAKNIAVVIQEDPRKTHRPVEALRIALGLAAGSHIITVVLLGAAVYLLSEETEDIIDVDILEKYLPSIEQLKIPFILEDTQRQIPVRSEFHINRNMEDAISTFIRSMDCVLVF